MALWKIVMDCQEAKPKDPDFPRSYRVAANVAADTAEIAMELAKKAITTKGIVHEDGSFIEPKQLTAPMLSGVELLHRTDMIEGQKAMPVLEYKDR